MIPIRKAAVLNPPTKTVTSLLESLKSNMVLWWDMQDTGDTLTDKSGNNRTGTVDNGSNSTINGRNWKTFNGIIGNISVTLPSSGSSYCIGGVYKPRSCTVDDNCRFFGINNAYNLELGIEKSDAGVGVRMYPVSGDWSDTEYDITSDVPILIFVDCDGSNTYLYVNGVKVKTFTGTHNTFSGDAKFGNSQGYDQARLNCDIGLILVTNRSLTESEHTSLFNQEKSKYGIS